MIDGTTGLKPTTGSGRRLVWYGRRFWWIAAGFLAAIAGAALFLRLGGSSDASVQAAVTAVPVVTATASSGDVAIEMEAIGRVTAFNIVTVRTLVGGQIKAITFKDGQTVKQGDPLVQIDPRALQATVNQDRALLERDQAILANAETDLKRYIPLVSGGIVSVQQAQTQRALVAQLRGTVGADQAALDRDQVQLGYTNITAPLSGNLGLRVIDVGNVANPSDPAGLVVLTQVQPITVLFALPQASLAEIQARQASQGGKGLAAEAWTQDGSRKLGDGTLAALSNQVDSASGTVTLKSVFPNPKQALWPGAAVSVRLVLDVQHDGLTVPGAAIDQGPQGPFVWLVDADGTAHSTPVKLQQLLHGQALIASGLKARDQVVTDGQYGLTSGAKVSVQAENTPHGRSAPLHTNQPNHLGISP